MAGSDQSDKSSSELSDCDGEKDKARDGSMSPPRRRHKKSKHSKKKSKKKSSKRKRHRHRSRSRSKERHSEKTKKLRDDSPSKKDQEDIKTDSKLQTDELTNEEVSLDASAMKEVACVESTNQTKVQADELDKKEVTIHAPANQKEFPDTLVIKNEPERKLNKKEIEALTIHNGPNKADSSFVNKTETVEHKLSLNINLEEIYDPGLYIASVKEENDSEQTAKESDNVKDEHSKLGSKESRSSSDKRRSRSKERHSKARQSRVTRSRSNERLKSNKKSVSRSRERSTEKSRQRSKDGSLERFTDTSHSKQKSTEKSRDHKRSKSRDSKRSKSRDRKRSKSRDSKKSEFRDQKRSKFRENRKSKSRERRSKSRQRRSRSAGRQRRSRSGSAGRRRRSRSAGRRRRSRSARRRRRSRSGSAGRRRRSRSAGRRRRSRSESAGRRRRSRSGSAGRRGRSRSLGRWRRSRSAGRRRDRQSRSRSPRKTDHSDDAAASVPVNLTIALGLPTTSVTTTTASAKPSKSIADFTALCKKLTEDKADEKNEINVGNEKVSQVYHPFSVKPAKEIVIPPVILPVSKPAEPTRPLEQAFPVSSGNQHKTKEHTNESVVEGVDGSVAAAEKVFQTAAQKEKLDVSGLVAKRMEAQNRLQSNPHDYEARLILEEVQMKIQSWASINLKPGQFTGESLVSLTPKENINSGYQAWAKKDMFRNLAPISSGVGMKLLQKMGWRPGQVLGKRGEGSYEPIALSVKTDRRGLVSFAEAGVKGKGGGKGGSKNMAAQAVQGKHPVSALAEFCTKRRWQSPAYNIAHESGPAHKKDFLYQVIVNGNSYQHNIASNNKKLAKAEAAFAALKALGVVPADAAMSL